MNTFHQIPRQVVIVSVLLPFVVAAVGIVPWRTAAAEAAGPVADKPSAEGETLKLTPAQEKFFRALDQPGRLEFIETPLTQVLDFIRDLHKIDVRTDEKALHDADITGNLRVTFHSRGMTLNNSLWLMLREHRLTHVIRGDTLLITTPQQAKQIVQEGGINPDGVKLWSGNSKVFSALADTTTLEFIEVPLQDVIDYLQDLHGIPIRLDKRALGKKTAGWDTPVTHNLKGITLNSALRLMLDEIGLTHVVSHGVVLISTPAERDRLVQHGGFEPDDIRLAPANKWVLPKLADSTTIEFIECPLLDVVDYMKDLHSIEIQLDRRAMRKAGIKPDAPVTQNLEGVTFHSALQKMLGQLGLTHVIQHEVLLITTPERGRQRLQAGALAPTDAEPVESISVAAALKKPVTVECREKPFHELVGVLKQQAGVEIRIDDWELATVDLTRNFPCTITARNVSLEPVLDQLLGGGPLGYFVENEMIVITGREAVVRHRNRSPESVAFRLERMGARLGMGRDGPQPYIARIDFGGSGRYVSDGVVEEIATLKQLRGLDLSGTGVTDAGLGHLADLRQLEELHVRNTRISDAGLTHIAALENLRILSLDRNVTDAGLKRIQGLTRLKEIHIARAGVTDAGLRFLSNMRDLEWLTLLDTNVTGAGLEYLPAPENLRRLHLGGTDMTDAALQQVARCTRLEVFDFWGILIADADLEHLRGLTQLKSLDLSYLDVSDAGLKHLSGLTRLRGLNLADTQVTDAGLAHLAGLTRLSELTLSFTQITGSGFAHLQMPRLERLALRKSKVNDEGLASMTHLTGLKRLDLSETGITDASAVHLRTWWQNVLASKRVDDDPFGGGAGDPFAGGAGAPFARRGPSCLVVARGTKFSRAAATKLNKELPGLRVIGNSH
jgi:Leucine-rich repeat (LRR) protein